MNKKKLLALLMSLVMTLTLMPMTVFAEEEQAQAPDLVANVQRIAGKQDVDLIALDTDEELGGNLADLRTQKVGKVDIDTIYRFTPSATDNVEKYGNWICDFRVTFDDDVKKNSAGLYGSYGSYLDIAFLAPVNVPANEPIFLLSAFGLDQHLTYDEVVNTVQIFDCGVFNVGACNAGTKMTVELVVNNRQDDIWYPVASRTYTFGSVSPVETNDGNFVYDDVNGTHNIVNTSFAGQPIYEKYTFKKFVVETGNNSTAEVNVDQISSVNNSSLTAENSVKDAIAAETKVTGVKLSTTDTVASTDSGPVDTTGLQAVINAAIAGGENITAKSTAGESPAVPINNQAAVVEAISDATSIEVKVNVVVTPTAYTFEETTKTATFHLTPIATVTATKTENEQMVSTTIENVPVTNEMIDQTQDILVSIYTGFAPAQIIHREDNGGKIIDVFNEGEFTYDTTTKVATVVVHHFSEMVASAESGVAEINGQKYETLAAAFADVEDGQTIVLLKDVSLTERLFVNAGATPAYAGTNNRYATTTGNKIITLDLNNHNIQSTSNIALAGGTLNITGTGTISTTAAGLAPVEVRGTGDLTTTRTLTIGSGVTLTGKEYGLNVFGSNDAQKNLINVNVNGTVNGMLFVLGNLTNEENAINIFVNGTVDASGVTGTDERVHTGIAICGNADVVVNNGATVTGESGIEVRAGSLTVNGGTITGTGTYVTPTSNTNGTTIKGAAIAVAQHSTGKSVNVTLSGGDLNGSANGQMIVVADPENQGNIASSEPTKAVQVVATESFKANSSIPEGYKWVESSGNYTLEEKELTFRGGSLRRRVYTGTTEVINFETDLRFGFMLPAGAEVNTDASYFRWSLSENVDENTGNRIDIKNVDTSGSRPLVNMVITKIPMAYYTSEIYCHAHIVYTIGGATHTVDTHVDGNSMIKRSVKDVCEGLIADSATPQVWLTYATNLKTVAGWN